MQKKRILILIDTATGWGRNIIRGIAQFANENRDWELSIQPRGQIDEMPIPPNWRGEGVIARIASSKILKDLNELKLPVVNVSSLPLKGCSYPRVISDYKTVGKMGARHMLDAGFHQFGFCATEHSFEALHEIRESFAKELKLFGIKPSYLKLPNSDFISNEEQDLILRWLEEKGKPLAIFGMSVKAPYSIISACKANNIHIPEEVAVLSNASVDELVLQIINPTVSCVVDSDVTIGFEAAKLLDTMMGRKKVSKTTKTIRIPPLRIEVRASSDIMQIPDEGVKKALRYMRENAHHGIQVNDVASHVGISRRSLEMRMRHAIQRSPADQLRQLRIEIASKLLTNTNLSIPDVAERSGFGTVEHFIVFYKKTTGLTPLQYSKKFGDSKGFTESA